MSRNPLLRQVAASLSTALKNFETRNYSAKNDENKVRENEGEKTALERFPPAAFFTDNMTLAQDLKASEARNEAPKTTISDVSVKESASYERKVR